jgi:CHRD domain-containing protein
MIRRFAPWLFAGALVVAGATTAWAQSGHFKTHLTGNEEVPAVVTGAQGQATFKLSDDGQSLGYKLNVANIEDVTQAHIHLAAPGVNGGIVVFLFGLEPDGVDVNGRLASGTITADDLINALAGQPLSSLITAIENGGAYVNVHTLAHPGGEIRGQL